MKSLISALIIFFFILSGCGKTPSPVSQKPIVLVSIAPYQHIAERISGQAIEVHSIVTLGANVHHFDPSVRQTQSMNNATVWFRIGEPFETRLLEHFQRKLHIVDLRDGIELISLDGKCSCCQNLDNQDRHMWMSPSVLKKQAVLIAKVLSEEFPQHQSLFEANLSSLLIDLDLLNQEIEHSLENVKNRTLLVAHPAFGYYCKDYHLKQVSIESEGKDPCPKYLQFILNDAKINRPTLVLSIPQHSDKGAQMLAKELNLPIKEIDPYSLDYFVMMRTLTLWIVNP